MDQISEKELAALNELLSEEELLIKKFKMLSEHTEDAEVKAKFTEISNKHQEHFQSLYAQLKQEERTCSSHIQKKKSQQML